MLFVAENLEVLPQISAGARIETGGRLVQQQNGRVMKQTLREFQPALHSAGKSLDLFLGTVGEADAREHFRNTRLQRCAVQAIHVPDEHQVLFRCELDVDALLLEDDADLAANFAGFFGDIVSHDERAAAGGNHQCREDAKGRSLAASVGAEQSKDLRRANLKRNACQRCALAVLMAQVLQLNDRGCRRVRLFDRCGCV